jgi:nicotinate-nucleotide pyrophosphorylase (carboxylating)
MDLASAVLIKDNHLVAVGGDIARAVNRAREVAPDGSTIEVECDRIEQVKAAIAAGADVILLDNMTPSQLKECVALGIEGVRFEASGGVTLGTVRAIAASGVDFVSVGGLTHSAPAMNLALDFYP